MQKIKVSIYGTDYEGRVSDIDALGFAGLLLPNYFDVQNSEKGLRDAFNQFAKDNADALEASGDDKEKIADAIFDAWGERFLIRITNNLDIRERVAQRLCEIFPSLPESLVSYQRWRDKEDRVHSRISISLDMEELMKMVVAIVGALPRPEVAAPKVEEAPVEPAKTIAQIQPPRLEAKGFAKPANDGEAVAAVAVVDTETDLVEKLKTLSEEQRKALLGAV